MSAKTKLGHLAIPAEDPQRLATFYSDLLGLEQHLAGAIPQMGSFVFLRDHAETPLTVGFMTRAEARHVAWEVESIAALRALYAEAQARGIPMAFAMNHGVTVSIYLRDPEGNVFELYWPTGYDVPGVFARPLDLTLFEQPGDKILAVVNEQLRGVLGL
jgi:catechol 2,3-dioxygenase